MSDDLNHWGGQRVKITPPSFAPADGLEGIAITEIETVLDRVGAACGSDAQRVLLHLGVLSSMLGRATFFHLRQEDPKLLRDDPRQLATARELLAIVAADFKPDDHGNARETLAPRRAGGSIDFHWQNGWASYTVGFTLYPGTLRCAEIFLNVGKSEGMAEANARDAGILASFALQHGATLAQLVAAVTHESDGSASSVVGTALNLVAAEIAKMRGGDTPDPDPVTPAPDLGPGDGGGVRNAAVPASVAEAT